MGATAVRLVCLLLCLRLAMSASSIAPSLPELKTRLQLRVAPLALLRACDVRDASFEGQSEALKEARVVLVGTAHVSKASAEDVAKCVSMVRPDGLFLELCSERNMLLAMDKDAYVEASKAITLSSTLEDLRAGNTETFTALYNLMLSSVARDADTFIAEEFRAAFDTFLALNGPEAKRFVLLGDRPVSITVARFWRGLSAWEKVSLVFDMLLGLAMLPAWLLCDSADDLQQDSDLLLQVLHECGASYPWLLEALVRERDQIMAAQLKKFVRETSLKIGRPATIVAVVGAGHMTGIEKHWKEPDADIKQLMVVPTDHNREQFRQFVKERVVALVRENPAIRRTQLQRRKWLAVALAGVTVLVLRNRGALVSKCMSIAGRLFHK